MRPIILSAEDSENHLFGILFVGGMLERSIILPVLSDPDPHGLRKTRTN